MSNLERPRASTDRSRSITFAALFAFSCAVVLSACSTKLAAPDRMDAGAPSSSDEADMAETPDGAVADAPDAATPPAPAPRFRTLITGGSYDRFMCVVMQKGTVMCWGSAQDGALGTGKLQDSQVYATPVVGIDGSPGNAAVALSSGNNHACALLDSGAVKCWGAGYMLGINDSTPDTATPTVIAGIDGVAAKADSISGGSGHNCAILQSGKPLCWGGGEAVVLGAPGTDYAKRTNSNDVVAMEVIDGEALKAWMLTGAWWHGCGIVDTPARTGAAMCWGRPVHGALGNGDVCPEPSHEVDTPVLRAVAVSGIDGSGGQRAISIGSYSDYTSCAVLDSGTVSCWGSNRFSQLGDPSIVPVDNPKPIPVSGIDGTPGNRALVLGGTSGGRCALMDSGTIKCWGSIGGSPGRVHSWDVLPVAGIDGTPGNRAVALSQSGASTVCVILDSGHVRCWGGSQYGPELGNGTADQSNVPVEVLTAPNTPLTGALVPTASH